MTHITLRELTDSARPGAAHNHPADEPSHIHIPRPSRLKQPVLTLSEDGTPVPPQLELALDDAA